MWLMAKVATSNRACASLRMEISMIGVSPIGTSGFGSVTVYGRNRVPLPPARMTAYLIPVPSEADRCASLDVGAQNDVGRDFETGIELGPLAIAHRVHAPVRGARIARLPKRRQQAFVRERLRDHRAGMRLVHVTGIAANRGRHHRQAVHQGFEDRGPGG